MTEELETLYSAWFQDGQGSLVQCTGWYRSETRFLQKRAKKLFDGEYEEEKQRLLGRPIIDGAWFASFDDAMAWLIEKAQDYLAECQQELEAAQERLVRLAQFQLDQ